MCICVYTPAFMYTRFSHDLTLKSEYIHLNATQYRKPWTEPSLLFMHSR